ncbi:MAG: serine/threonine protein kinase [Ardenticatenales bacterium]|nr:serine/threonine protein kinase [Ardenticatenales bacterium]
MEPNPTEARWQSGADFIKYLAQRESSQHFREQHWEGSFAEYLDIVRASPAVARSAFQRIYDMILSHGSEQRELYRQSITHYRFFDDPFDHGKDAIFGLDSHLMELVDFFHSAARRYGTEKRVLLLHGPVGSSKSTIARLLKKGLEHYSRVPEGALYSYRWVNLDEGEEFQCPMHEEPLHLLPLELRRDFLTPINASRSDDYQLDVEGDLCPACRFLYQRLMGKYEGDLVQMLEHVKVRRLILSEKDRVGIGTFQPKDEKNQDSTELTGDINYRKIAEYGSDSDPRAFSFDGEFNISNRGIVEFVEVLKLDVAFLYDLLGASQEHKIKPKKFAQTDIDEVILGHSVTGETPIAYRHEGSVRWTTLAGLYERFYGNTRGLEVMAYNFEAREARWTPVKALFRHRFNGELLTTSQKWGVVETTPNHSIYDRNGEMFYPEERREVMAVRDLRDEFTLARPEVIDVVAGIEGFVREDMLVTAAGGPMTRPCRPGWTRLDLPRHATEIRAIYDPLVDVEELKALITVLVWYATEGHVNHRNGGIVITQADREELERVQRAYQLISSAKGSIDWGAKTDSAWRLYLGSQAIARLVVPHCGELSENKRLPDFLFHLPRPYLEHAFEELSRTDGSRVIPEKRRQRLSVEYQEKYFSYGTTSPTLAAQVGTLITILGHNYSLYHTILPDRKPAYHIRFVSSGKRGGQRSSSTSEPRLHSRPSDNEWVYDIECVNIHNFIAGIGNVVLSNTNEPEYRKLQSNEYMEALRDRTVKIDVPYITRLGDEIKIYQKDFSQGRIRGKHIAPHVVEVAAMWAVLTRLEEPKHAGLTLMQKLRLYDGKTLRGFTEDNVRELRDSASREGMEGISPRYIQDKVSNALVNAHSSRHPDEVDSRYPDGCANPFMVLAELETGLRHHSLINSEDQRQRYRELLATVKEEYDDIVKNEVQRAITADEAAIQRLSANYIDNVKAYTQRERVRNRFTGQEEEPDERLMRSIEEKIDIPDSRKDDFRREVMNYIAAMALDGKIFDYTSNPRLQKALELKLFEDQKDSIKLTSLVTSVVDRETQEKIDVVKGRLINNYGYCEVCASDVLNYVASIFARGDARKN